MLPSSGVKDTKLGGMVSLEGEIISGLGLVGRIIPCVLNVKGLSLLPA